MPKQVLSRRSTVFKYAGSVRIPTVLVIAAALAIILLWAGRDDPAGAQADCTFNRATGGWDNCATPGGALLNGDKAREIRACRYLYEHEVEGAYFDEAQDYLDIIVRAKVKTYWDARGYEFERLEDEPYTWAFNTSSRAFPVDWQWYERTSTEALNDNLELMEQHVLELQQSPQRPDLANLDETLALIEAQQALLTDLIRKNPRNTAPFFTYGTRNTLHVDRLPSWALAVDPDTAGFWQWYLRSGPRRKILAPDPDTLTVHSPALYGIMGLPRAMPRWNPTARLGIETLQCEAWAHIAYVASDWKEPYCPSARQHFGVGTSYSGGTPSWRYGTPDCLYRYRHCPSIYRPCRPRTQREPNAQRCRRPYTWKGRSCYHEIDRGTITGGGGAQATQSELADGPPGETFGDLTLGGLYGTRHGRGNAARWYQSGPDQEVPEPVWLTFDPVIEMNPHRKYLRVGIPTYVWLNNVPSSCLPKQPPFPLPKPDPDDWQGCQAQMVDGREASYQIIWPTKDTPLIDTVVRQAATRYKSVIAEKMVIDLESDGTPDHTCWTEDDDVADAERRLNRGWIGDKGVSAPGIRSVASRPITSRLQRG